MFVSTKLLALNPDWRVRLICALGRSLKRWLDLRTRLIYCEEMLVCYLLLLMTVQLVAQPLSVYSEFAQLDSGGRVIAPADPREIDSPAMARNAFTSLQVVVQVQQGHPYLLQVGQNPGNRLRVTVYRERGNSLEPVELPYRGESTQVFWMDVWVPAAVAVQRIKIEPQLEIGGDWWVHPMEARIKQATMEESKMREKGSAAPFAVMKRFVCGGSNIQYALGGEIPSITQFHFRNAQQDVELAAKATSQIRAGYLAQPRMEQLKTFLGGCSKLATDRNPESYLLIRDFLLKLP